jgi:hypothetical protein
MEDCTTHWIAATAYNEAGSSVHSDYVATWPRPRVSGVTCLGGNTIRPGTSTTCAVTGDNLKGEATIRLTDSSGIQPAGVEITRVTVTSFCHSLSFSVTLDESSACPGGCTLELLVTQPSGVGSVPVSALTVQDRPPAPALVDVR